MRYILVALLMINLSGCGSSNTEEEKEVEKITAPTSPLPSDKSKQPPDIPKI